MIKSYERGNPIYFSADGVWRYCDNDLPIDGKRCCARCGKPPNKDGSDACLGHLEGMSSACCGHGVYEPIRVKENK